MISGKKFVKIFFILFAIFLLYHAIIWNLYTSKIFGRKDGKYVGDLGRSSYQVCSLYPRKLQYTLPKRHIGKQNFHGQKIDMITMGDSFSNADTGGLNPYYQDYLATKYNLNILNLRREPLSNYNSYKLVLYLYNSGWLKKYKPKYILIQSVGRFIYNRYAQKFDMNFSKKPKYLIEKTKTTDSYIPHLLLINTANYKFFTSKIYFALNHGKYKGILKFNLNKKMFSVKKFQDKLLVTDEDLLGIHNDISFAKFVNDNFNKLAKLLKPMGITLIFLPSVDKYDLYTKYIINNTHQKNLFFENMRKLKKDYVFVDTKKILRDYMKTHQDRDIFYPDDTHWSYKASDIITNDKVFSFLKH